MSVTGLVSEKLKKLIDDAENLFGPAAVSAACPKRAKSQRKRSILRQSLVQTCQVHVEDPVNPLHDGIAPSMGP